MTTATLRDHLAAQGGDAEAYVRGARVQRRAAAGSDNVSEAVAFVPVRVEPTAQPQGGASCRIKHPSGLVLEFEQWPEPGWLASFVGAVSRASR